MKFILNLFAVVITIGLVDADRPVVFELAPATPLENITRIHIHDAISTRGHHSVHAKAHDGGFLFELHGHEGKATSEDVVKFFQNNIKSDNTSTVSAIGLPSIPTELDFAAVINYRAEWLVPVDDIFQLRKFSMKNILIGYLDSKKAWYIATAKHGDCHGNIMGGFSCVMKEYPTPVFYSACVIVYPPYNSTQFAFTWLV
mmetsp:Transcript_10358/g.16908  ORF Transcript_10358/g.16908 Transcript_10358/m.16908 type:complete len:200 (+) Transcript_10358:803-1402(+)|eukprot:CAMPEP_0203781060 /NCGR_PEP_ID=MMETSP0099_2-20121227/9941_1 /ASSEMBLY_ACC=CAM_ASM_000209 /TAXON_ID=96639 /ORGANISM=" , Strain NY0313808BC1" /LENGTH=199 /DNA_ID=CAMNT_0050681835 /DNA_START=768 /DNA_END=1367 /DNA_ORIENTATION=+